MAKDAEGNEIIEKQGDETVEDVFSEAFDKAAEAADGGAVGDVVIDDAAEEARKAEEAKKAEEAAKAAENKTDEERALELQAKGEPPVKKEEGVETYEQQFKTLQGIHRKDRETWEEEKRRMASELEGHKAKLAAAEAERTKKAADLTVGDLTEEEQEALKEYEEDFKTVSKMEGKKREIELARLRADIDAFKKEVLDRVAPVEAIAKETQELTANVAREEHFGTLKKAHPDYEKFRDDNSIVSWMNSKPSYIKSRMMEVYDAGSAAEIVELITDFKKENNITTATDDSAQIINIDTKKQEKKQAMMPVVSRRGAVQVSTAVATDFDGAFDEAVRKLGGS